MVATGGGSFFVPQTAESVARTGKPHRGKPRGCRLVRPLETSGNHAAVKDFLFGLLQTPPVLVKTSQILT